MERAPDLYSWSDVLVDDDAVLGVWNQRFQVRHGDHEARVQAVVLDSGFVPGLGEAALERLIRASCRGLVAAGSTHLVVFTSTLSPDRDLVVGLGGNVVEFVHSCRVPEPQPPTGIRFDPIYF